MHWAVGEISSGRGFAQRKRCLQAIVVGPFLTLVAALVMFGAPSAAFALPAWSGPMSVDQNRAQTINSVSCPSASQCTAVDASGQEVTYSPSL
jgi:hypothetical protein